MTYQKSAGQNDLLITLMSSIGCLVERRQTNCFSTVDFVRKKKKTYCIKDLSCKWYNYGSCPELPGSHQRALAKIKTRDVLQSHND